MSESPPQPEALILYNTTGHALEVLSELESFSIDQRHVARLFGIHVRTVGYHQKEER